MLGSTCPSDIATSWPRCHPLAPGHWPSPGTRWHHSLPGSITSHSRGRCSQSQHAALLRTQQAGIKARQLKQALAIRRCMVVYTFIRPVQVIPLLQGGGAGDGQAPQSVPCAAAAELPRSPDPSLAPGPSLAAGHRPEQDGLRPQPSCPAGQQHGCQAARGHPGRGAGLAAQRAVGGCGWPAQGQAGVGSGPGRM